MQKTFIFDFDGTIIQDSEQLLAALNQASIDLGYKPITPIDVQIFRNQGIHKFFQQLNISKPEVPKLISLGMKHLSNTILDASLIPGIANLLKTLHHQGHFLAITTSNTTENVHSVLTHHQINYFNQIDSGSISSKEKSLEKILFSNSLNLKCAYYIGDEDRDIKAAQMAGISSIAVTWGFNDTQLLTSAKPNYLVTSPQELLELCSTLSI